MMETDIDKLARLAPSHPQLARLHARAVSGNAQAATMLGDAFRDGLDTEPDISVARWYYELGAVLGCPVAMNNLAVAFLVGLGTAPCYLTAFYWAVQSDRLLPEGNPNLSKIRALCPAEAAQQIEQALDRVRDTTQA